jgi:uncharacterized protein (DUF2384 family)
LFSLNNDLQRTCIFIQKQLEMIDLFCRINIMKEKVMNNLATGRSTDRSRVLSQSVVEAAHRLKVGSTDLGEILGFSQSTSSRLLNHKYAIQESSKEWELSAHFLRLYRSLFTLVGGDDELAVDWMTSQNKAFNQQTPISYIKRIDGLIYACEYLDAHRATV